MQRRSITSVPPVLLASVIGLSACGGEAAASVISVTSGNNTCELSASQVVAGSSTFQLSNTGDQVTEMYIYGPGDRVVGEVENVKPRTKDELTVQLDPGDYSVACKQGMTGDGVRTKLTVTGDAQPITDARLTAATERYKAYVQNQVAELLTRTEAFAGAVKGGNVDKAKALYGPSRVPWERIEPVAESFGDIDPKVDARENDVEPGQPFTGWHRLEKDLWVTGLQPDSGQIADQLLADLHTLARQTETLNLTPSQLSNGAKELLEEVATGKVTGEEERYSHLDLLDFEANVAGSKEAYEALKPVVVERDASLATELDQRFADVTAGLAPYRTADGFVTYDKLTPSQVKDLANKVEALSEPLSRLTAVVAS